MLGWIYRLLVVMASHVERLASSLTSLPPVIIQAETGLLRTSLIHVLRQTAQNQKNIGVYNHLHFVIDQLQDHRNEIVGVGSFYSYWREALAKLPIHHHHCAEGFLPRVFEALQAPGEFMAEFLKLGVTMQGSSKEPVH